MIIPKAFLNPRSDTYVRGWKLILLAVIILGIWYYHSGSHGVPNVEPPRLPGTGPKPTGALEQKVASDVLSVLGQNLTLDHRFARKTDNTLVHFLYYKPLPDVNPDQLAKGLEQRGYKILHVTDTGYWVVVARGELNGSEIQLSVYPSADKNFLVISAQYVSPKTS